MTDRTESCTPEERRLLDILADMTLKKIRPTRGGAMIYIQQTWRPRGLGYCGHDLAEALHAVRGNRD